MCAFVYEKHACMSKNAILRDNDTEMKRLGIIWNRKPKFDGLKSPKAWEKYIKTNRCGDWTSLFFYTVWRLSKTKIWNSKAVTVHRISNLKIHLWNHYLNSKNNSDEKKNRRYIYKNYEWKEAKIWNIDTRNTSSCRGGRLNVFPEVIWISLEAPWVWLTLLNFLLHLCSKRVWIELTAWLWLTRH